MSVLDYFQIAERVQRNESHLSNVIDEIKSFEKYWGHYAAYWVGIYYLLSNKIISDYFIVWEIASVAVGLAICSVMLFIKLVRPRTIDDHRPQKDIDVSYVNTLVNNPNASEPDIAAAVLRDYNDELDVRLELALKVLNDRRKILADLLMVCLLSLLVAGFVNVVCVYLSLAP